MFDNFILLTDRYAIWLAALIGFYKILHIIFYKGLRPGYILSTFFIFFSDVQLTDTKSSPQRYRFRQLHNILTVCFYGLLVIWGVIHLILIEV